MVNCQVMQDILTCSSSNRVVLQFCAIDGGPAVNCSGAFDISSLGLAPGNHTITVFITDIFQQELDINIAYFVAPGMAYS